MKIDFSKKFRKRYRKLPKKTQVKFEERLALFISNPEHPLLNVHILIGQYKGCMSINVTGDIRALFEEQKDDVILFVAIGSHSELYG